MINQWEGQTISCESVTEGAVLVAAANNGTNCRYQTGQDVIRSLGFSKVVKKIFHHFFLNGHKHCLFQDNIPLDISMLVVLIFAFQTLAFLALLAKTRRKSH